MRKKADGQKCIRLGFTIEPEIGRAFLDKVQKDGVSQSSVFAEMVKSYLSGSISSIGSIGLTDTNNNQSEIEELKAELKRLSSDVQELKNAKVARNTSLTDYIDSTEADVITPGIIAPTQTNAIEVLPVTPMDVSPDPVNVNSVPVNEVSIKEMVFHVLGHEIQTDDPLYDAISKRIKRLLAKNNVIKIKVGKYPRADALQIIDTNIEELKKKPSKGD